MIDEQGNVSHEVRLERSAEDVYAFFTDPARLVAWIGIDAVLEPVPGGEFRFEIQPGEWCRGRYTVTEPPNRVAFTWGWDAPSWDLPPGTSLVEVSIEAAADGSTLLRLVHRNLPGGLRALHDEGWTMFLSRLAAVCAGTAPAAYPPPLPDGERP